MVVSHDLYSLNTLHIVHYDNIFELLISSGAWQYLNYPLSADLPASPQPAERQQVCCAEWSEW